MLNSQILQFSEGITNRLPFFFGVSGLVEGESGVTGWLESMVGTACDEAGWMALVMVASDAAGSLAAFLDCA
jgi:hypothetical protein